MSDTIVRLVSLAWLPRISNVSKLFCFGRCFEEMTIIAFDLEVYHIINLGLRITFMKFHLFTRCQHVAVIHAATVWIDTLTAVVGRGYTSTVGAIYLIWIYERRICMPMMCEIWKEIDISYDISWRLGSRRKILQLTVFRFCHKRTREKSFVSRQVKNRSKNEYHWQAPHFHFHGSDWY